MIPGSPTSRLSSKASPHATPSGTVNSSPSTKSKSWTEAPVLVKEKGNRLFKLRKSQVKVRSNSPGPDADSSYISAGGYSAAGIRVPGPTKVTKTNENQQQQKQHNSAIAAEESSETTSHGGYSAAGIRLPSSRRSSRLLRYKAAHLRSNVDKANNEGINNCDTTNDGISSDHYSPAPPSLSRIKSISNTTRDLDAFFADTKQPPVDAASPGDNGTHASGDRAAGGSTILYNANRGDDGNYYYHPQKQTQYSLFSQPIHPHPTFAAAIRPSTATTSVKSSTAYSCTTRTISEDLRSNTSEEPSISSTIRSAQEIESLLLFQKPDFLKSQSDVSSHRSNIMPYNRGSLKFGPPLKPRPSIQGSSSSSVLSDLPYIPPRKAGLILNTRRNIQQTLLSSRSDRSFSESEGFSSSLYDSKGSSKVNFLLPEKSEIRSRSRTHSRDNNDWPSASSVTLTSSVISDLPEVPPRQARLVPEAVGADRISLNHTQQQQQQQQQIEANGQLAESHQDDSVKKADVPLQKPSYMQEREEREIFDRTSQELSGATNISYLQRSGASSSVASSFVSALPIVPPRPIGLIPNKSADLNRIYGYHAARDGIGEIQGSKDESNMGLNDTDKQLNSNMGNEPQFCRFNPHMSESASPLVVTATDATLPSSSGHATSTTTFTAICISGTSSESFNGQSALSNEEPLIIDHEKRRTFLQNLPALKKMQHQVSGLTMSGTESGSSSKIEAEKEPNQTQTTVSEDNHETKVAVNLTDELEACRQYLSSEKAPKEVILSPLDTSDQKREKIRSGRNLVLARDSTLAVSDLTISSSLLRESNASLQNTSWYGPSLVRVEEIMDYDSDDDADEKETRENLKGTDASQNSESKDAHSRLNSQYIAGAIDARTIRRYDEEGDLAAGTVARNFVGGHVVDGGEKQMDEQPEPQLFANVMRSTSQCVDQVTEWPIISQKKTIVNEPDLFCDVLVDEGASVAVQCGGSIEDNNDSNDEGQLSTNSSSNKQRETLRLDSDSAPTNISYDIIEAKTEQGFSSTACDIEEKINFEVEGTEEKKERSEFNLVQKPVLSPLEDEFTSELEVDFPTKIRDVEAIGDLDVAFPPLERQRSFRPCILGNETDRIVKVDNVIGSKISGKETCEESLAEPEDRSVSSSFSKRSKNSQYYRLAEEDSQEAKSACSNPNGLVNNDRPEVQSVSSFSIFKGTRLNSSSNSVSSEGSRRPRYSHLETKDDPAFKSLIREEQQNNEFNVLTEEKRSVIIARSFPDSLRIKMDSSSQSSKGSMRSHYSRLSRGKEREEKLLIDREQIEETMSVDSVNKEDKSVNSRVSVSSSSRNHLNSSCHSVSSKGSRRSHHSRLESEDDHKSLTSSEERKSFRKSIERRRREDIFNSGFVDEGIIIASDEEKEKLEVVKERSSRNAFMRDFSNIYDVESNEGMESLDEISVLESLHEGLDSEDELSKTTEGKEPGALYETWKRCTKPCGQMSWWKWTAVIAVCFLIVGGIVAAIVVPRASSTAHSASSAPTTSGTPPSSTNSTGIDASIFDDTPWDESYIGGNNLGLPGDGTGVSVSLSGYGNRLAVGSPYLNTSYGTRAGLVSLYDGRAQEGKMLWTLVGQLFGNSSGQEFGVSVSLNELGDILAIGSVNNNGALSSNYGSICVYRIQERTPEDRSRGLTGQSRKRLPSNSAKATAAVVPHEMSSNYGLQQVGQTLKQNLSSDGNYYGLSLSLSNSGNILAIGAPNADNNSGRVSVYAYNSEIDNWNPVSLSNDTGYKDDNLGWSVAISGDGTILAAGAPQHQGSAHGYVNVYHLTSDAGQLTNTISSSGSWTNSVSSLFLLDRFGFSVSLDDAGGILAIGSPNSTVTNVAKSAGVAAVFLQDPSTSQWSVMGGKVFEGEAGDELGFAVSLSSSGTRIAVGAPYTNKSGAVLIYDFFNNSWQMGPPIKGNGTGSDLGYSVSLNSEGTEVAVGLPFLTGCQLSPNMQRRLDSVCNAGTSMIYKDALHKDVDL